MESQPHNSESSLQLDRLEEVFFAALEQTSADRPALLDEMCGSDHALRAEVERMLRADDDHSSVIERAPWTAGRIVERMHQSSEPDPVTQPGARIGRYRILRPLGEGGFGGVFLAEQQEPVERQVALKVLKRGLDSGDILHRFRRERQVLAQLDHPNIAHLLDGGMTVDHRPYLVMEYVEGTRIDAYCADSKLSIEDRLALFSKVCNAVHHAHRNLIVHRDLKPSNILITREGEPKLLDFGIAKVLDPQDAAQLSITSTEFRVMTPRYASPEQIRGEAITTASDVYSLGVILYELLTGCRPYRVQAESRQELERVVLDQEPTRPSLVVHRTTDDSTGAGTTRTKYGLPEINPRRLSRLLQGDLDTIVLTALRKEPQDRYGSAEQLADDLQRYVDGLPILARRTGVYTRFVKALRRNRREFAASIVGGILVLALAVAITVYLFVVPTWVQSHLDAARLELLDPGQSNNIVIAVYQQREDHGLNPSDRAVEPALAHYDAALRLYPTRSDIRLERDVVRLATGDASDIDVSSLDDRSRGLLAMLTADVTTAVDAWSQRDFVTNPDPLAEGLLGIYYLANDEPARAYPRLTSAYKALPEAGFLCVSLAEAAARCGDGEAALELIERARTLGNVDDETGGAERVQALALASAGRLDQAIELYERSCANGYNPIAFVHYAGLLGSLDREREAVFLLAQGMRIVNHWTKVNRIFIERADVWWSRLSDDERQALIESRRHDDPTEPDTFSALLFAYGVASRALDRADAERSLSAAATVEPSLADLAASITIIDLMGWIRCDETPPDELATQIWADLTGPGRTLSPETQQEVLDEAHRYANRFYFAGD